MDEKLISVIVPIYNGEKFIGRCLRSLLHQSIDQTKYEIIIVNDGSTDKTRYALDLFEGDLIKVYHNDHNKGLPYSLNVGINNSCGKYIVRVDADDYVNEHYLLILSAFLELNNKIHAAVCDYLLVNDKEEVIKRCNSLEEPIGCGIMFKKDALFDIGLYDENMKIHEDKDLMMRFKEKFNINRIELPLYRYRRHDKNMTNNKELLDTYYAKLRKKHHKKI